MSITLALIGAVNPVPAQEVDPPLREIPDVIPGDYTFYANATAPRLNGRVIHVGPRQEYSTLTQAERDIEPGTLVVLHRGDHVIPRRRDGWNDIALVGEDPKRTTLTGELYGAERLRIEGLRILCLGDEFLDIRGGAAQLRDCHISGYNTEDGGSKAVYGRDAVLLIERCTFDGKTGGEAELGQALDLRGQTMLFARDCEFVDNAYIVRATGVTVFDRCRSRNASEESRGIAVRDDAHVYLHHNNNPLRDPELVKFLSALSDDLGVVRTLAGDAASPEQRKAAEPFERLRDSIPYWIGLLRSDNADVRSRARRRLDQLIDAPMPRKEWKRAASGEPLLSVQELEATWLWDWQAKQG